MKQLLPVLEQHLGPISIINVRQSFPEHGTGSLDKKFRPCWLDLDTSGGPVKVFLKAPHNAEPAVYIILADLAVSAPRLWGTFILDGEEICVLDDCGRTNLAQVPGNSVNWCERTPEPVITALARLHAVCWGKEEAWGAVGWRDAAFYLQRLGKMDFSGWVQSPYRESFAANGELLDKSRLWLKENLAWVFAGTWGLTHGDASAVNVAVDDKGSATLVDWGDSRISTCLWDLPQLVNTPHKFRLWYETLAAICPGIPGHDELYGKYLGAALFAALSGCASRLVCWNNQYSWAPEEYMKPEAVEQQFRVLRDIWCNL